MDIEWNQMKSNATQWTQTKLSEILKPSSIKRHHLKSSVCAVLRGPLQRAASTPGWCRCIFYGSNSFYPAGARSSVKKAKGYEDWSWWWIGCRDVENWTHALFFTDVLCAAALFFTDVLNGSAVSPETWKTTKMKVLFKKGDAELPKNYRPISIIPVLAKLFSTLL